MVLHQDTPQQVPNDWRVGLLLTSLLQTNCQVRWQISLLTRVKTTSLLSSDDPRYNLASELYSSRWDEGIYRLLENGHCHTFNPENVSLSGLLGQHYFNLGRIIQLYIYMTSCHL